MKKCALLPLLFLLLTAVSCSESDFQVPVTAELWNCPPAELETIVTQPLEDLLKPIEGVTEIQSITEKGKVTVYLAFKGSEITPTEAYELVNIRLKANVSMWRGVLPEPPTIQPMVRKGESFLTIQLSAVSLSDEQKMNKLLALTDSLLVLPEILYVDKKPLPRRMLAIKTDVSTLSTNLLTFSHIENFISNKTSDVAGRREGSKGRLAAAQAKDTFLLTSETMQNLNLRSIKLRKVANISSGFTNISDAYTLTIQAVDGNSKSIQNKIEAVLNDYALFDGITLESVHPFNPLGESPASICLSFEGGTPAELALQADKFCEGMSSANIKAHIHQTAAQHRDEILEVQHAKLETSRLSAANVYYTAACEVKGHDMGAIFLDGNPVEVRLFYTHGKSPNEVMQTKVPVYLTEYNEYINVVLGRFCNLNTAAYCDIHQSNKTHSLKINLFSEDVDVEQLKEVVALYTSSIKLPEGITCAQED